MMSSKLILLLQIAVCLHTTLGEDSTSWLSTSADSTIPSVLCNQSFDIIYCANNEFYILIDFVMSTNSSSITIGEVGFGLQHSSSGQKYPFICYRKIPLNFHNVNAFFCNYSHRQDYLCATCQDGYGISMYTYYGLPCAPRCSDYGIVLYLLLEVGFSTLFFALVFSFGISANSSKWNDFIFYSQIVAIAISTNPLVFTVVSQGNHHLPAILHSLYGIWNMDYFRLAIRPFCVSKTISTLGALSCGYIAALWPLILILLLSFAMHLHKKNIKVAVYIWHYIKKISCKHYLAGTNLIHVFATFFLLCYIKAIYTSFSILQITFPLDLDMETGTLVPKRYLSADPHIAYFSRSHLPYAIPALVVVFILGVILPLLLVLYTTRCNTILFRKTGRVSNALKAFIDAFQGSYKDGTSGTRDYRAVSALYVVMRLITGLIYGGFFQLIHSSRSDSYSYPITALFFIVLAGFFGLARPYKTKRHNLLDVLLHTLSAIQVIGLYIITSYAQRSVVRILICLIFLPIVVILCVTLRKLIISVRIPKVFGQFL